MITNQTIEEQIRAIFENAASDESSRQQVTTEVISLLKQLRGSDLALDNLKPGGGGDLALDNIKPGGEGDLALDNLKPGGGGDLAVDGSAAKITEIIELVRAGSALGQAKAVAAELRSVQAKLRGEERARVERATNHLETALSVIEDSYRKFSDASARAALGARRRAANGGQAVHVHLHLGS